MKSSLIAGSENAITLLRRLATSQPQTEHCEFCSSGISSLHRHVLEISTGKVICACDPCALRFENLVAKLKLIPRDPIVLAEFALPDADWESFALPINLAFFYRSTPAGKVKAMYPSPAGATESLLPLASWQGLIAANPQLENMEPDVQALLVNRLGTTREYYIAPIDLCFELVGLIRLHWRGFSGGDKVSKEIKDFFEKLKARGKRTSQNPVHLTTEVLHA